MKQLTVSCKGVKSRLFFCLFFILIFFLLALLCSRFVLTCDDITYSLISDKSIKNLFNLSLYQGNGRLFGNFFGYTAGYSKFTLVERSLLWTGIIVLVFLIVGSKSKITAAASALMLIFPCDTIFSEVYAWNAGFQNYAFPVFIILLDAYIILNSAEIAARGRLFLAVMTAILCLTSLAGQFFSENSSLFAVILAAVLL